MKSFKVLLLSICLTLLAQAHVGSPDVYLDGQAGPYQLFVTIRPPAVIPGVAELEIRSQSAQVRAIRAVPVPLTPDAAKFAPVPDRLKVSAQDPQLFTGSLWIMTPGSWQVRVTVEGNQGTGVLSVPLPSAALTTKSMQFGLGAVLLILMILLAGGLVLMAGASAREAQLPSGVKPGNKQLQQARTSMIVALLAVIGVLSLGRWWWSSSEVQYRANVYKPLLMSATLHPGAILTLNITDSGWLEPQDPRLLRLRPAFSLKTLDDLIPDHDHLMHLYAIRKPGLDVVYHLHPEMTRSGLFQLSLPDMQPGVYQLYADVVHANGFPETMTASVRIPPALPGRSLSGDDASGQARPWQESSPATTSFPLPDGYTMEWLRPAKSLKAKEATSFRFRLLDTHNRPASDMQFYMGMLGHAAFVKTDETAFAHIHPTGSVAMASFMLAQSQLGDNSSMSMSPHRPGMDHSHYSMAESLPNEVAFPYGFPSPGRYRIFVQMKHGGRIETGIFDADVT